MRRRSTSFHQVTGGKRIESGDVSSEWEKEDGEGMASAMLPYHPTTRLDLSYAPSARAHAFPSKCFCAGSPNNFNTVGATSTMAGFSSTNFLFENSTPGTRRGSMQ